MLPQVGLGDELLHNHIHHGPGGRCTVRVTVEVLDPQQGFSVVGSETHDFLYEQVGERWIFTTFSMVR